MYCKLKLNYARNSLRYIIKSYNITQMYIPFYLCDVIRHSLIKENCKPIFYHIDDNFLPMIEFPKDSYILYPNYFGICEDNIKYLSNNYEKLIVDNAHAFYSKPQGFACFNSERKFHPVNKGSYLWIKEHSIKLDTDPIACKFQKHLDIFEENKIKDTEILITQKLEKEFNFKQKRLEKFILIHEKYKSTNLININIKSVDSPFCYPYLAKDYKTAYNIVKELKSNKQIIYRYWNELPKTFSEYKFYQNLVPIPLI